MVAVLDMRSMDVPYIEFEDRVGAPGTIRNDLTVEYTGQFSATITEFVSHVESEHADREATNRELFQELMIGLCDETPVTTVELHDEHSTDAKWR